MNLQQPKSKQPIPEHAKRVFKGVIFDVYQWEQEMFDGTKQTFEKLKRPDTVMVIPVTKSRKIILTEQEQPGKAPFKSVVGGRADEGEDPEVCAERELLEETGYKAKNLTLWETFQPISKIDWTIYTFIAKGCKKTQDPQLDAGERIQTRLVSFDEFVETIIREKFADMEIVLNFMEAKLDPKKMEALRQLFG